jgi:fatty acid desaturase
MGKFNREVLLMGRKGHWSMTVVDLVIIVVGLFASVIFGWPGMLVVHFLGDSYWLLAYIASGIWAILFFWGLWKLYKYK